MKKNFLKVSGFIVLFVIALICVVRVCSFKYVDGIYTLEAFYEQEENINDVLFIGSSNVFEGINTAILWDEYGIASFDLAASNQPIWNSYYFIKEALKTQNPKLIVVDFYGVEYGTDYSDLSRIVKNTYGMRLSKEKVEAKKTSSEKEMWNTHMWEIPTYHTRYRELKMEDFLPHLAIPNYDAWKGFTINPLTIAFEKPDGFQTDKTVELTEKVEKYLRQICEYCKENNVELLFIKTPNITDIDRTMRYNMAAEIVAEYDMPFVNFNYFYDDIGLDFSKDMADNAHLNYRGNVKFTRYLADYLKNNYEIPDRRGMQGYESYDKISLDCKARTENANVYDTYDLDEFLELIQQKNYLIVYGICGYYKEAGNYNEIAEKLRQYGVELENQESSNVWVIQNGEILYDEINAYDYLWYKELAPYKTLEVKAQGMTIDSHAISFNREKMDKVNSGLNIVVYDTITQTIVDSVGFPIVNGRFEYNKIR